MLVPGEVILSWNDPGLSVDMEAAFIAAACLCRGVDHNLTRKLSSAAPVQFAMVKGLAAGAVNLAIGLMRRVNLPHAGIASAAMAVGFFGVNVSLVLFVLVLRHLGTARTGAYFSLARLIGAVVAIGLLGELATVQLVLAGILRRRLLVPSGRTPRPRPSARGAGS